MPICRETRGRLNFRGAGVALGPGGREIEDEQHLLDFVGHFSIITTCRPLQRLSLETVHDAHMKARNRTLGLQGEPSIF